MHRSGLGEKLGMCGETLEPEKDYLPSKDAWFDENHEFHDYSYQFQTTANMEFYDFSSNVGDGLWGFFAEGGRPYCKNPQKNKDCENMLGYHTTGKILNIQTCESRPIGSPVSRTLPRGKSSKKGRTVEHFKTFSFFAFATLGDAVYQIAFKTDKRPEGSCPADWQSCPMTEDGTYLYLTKISHVSSPDTPPVFCTFKPKVP